MHSRLRRIPTAKQYLISVEITGTERSVLNIINGYGRRDSLKFVLGHVNNVEKILSLFVIDLNNRNKKKK